MPILSSLVRISFLTSIIISVSLSAPQAQTNYEQDRQCQITTELLLPKIDSLLTVNDYVEMEQVLQDIEKNCGPNEVTRRVRLIGKIIQKLPTDELILDYIEQGGLIEILDRQLQSVLQVNDDFYQNNMATYNYVPLNHVINVLIENKAKALLKSEYFKLSSSEEFIIRTFSGEITNNAIEETIVDLPSNTQLKPVEKAIQQSPIAKKSDEIESYKNGWGVTINAGLYRPVYATNPIFNNQAIFSIAALSPLSNDWIYEFYLKIRSNKGSRPFDYDLYGTPVYVESPLNYMLGVTAGRKLLDNGKFMLIGKGGIGFESIVTGLTEVYDWFDTVEGVDRSSIDFNNVDTFNLSAGLSAMQHVFRRTFLGAQIQYHYSPYGIDRRLITPIASNYVSFEVFFRF